MNVATKIATLEAYRWFTLERLNSCAVSLINHVQQSSGLTCDQPLRHHFVFSSLPADELSKAIIENKRIGRDLILGLLASHLAELIVLHTSQPLKAIDLPAGHHVLEKKMAVGGISYPSIAIAKDHRPVLAEGLGRHRIVFGETGIFVHPGLDGGDAVDAVGHAHAVARI
jgi:hypothetical protein